MTETFRVPEEKISDNASMKDVSGWDSLSHMTFILELEQKYGVQLSGDDIAEMQGVPDIVKILNQHNPGCVIPKK